VLCAIDELGVGAVNLSAMDSSPRRLSTLSIFALVLIAFIWGSNFVVIKIGLAQFPPFLMGVLRFAFASLPMLYFFPRPKTPLRWLVLGGLFFSGQFGLLFLAMRNEISPGFASLLMQSQVFITVLLAAFLFKERVSVASLLGLVVAAFGLLVIIFHADKTITTLGLVLILVTAFFLASGNIVVKYACRDAVEPIHMLAYTVWSSLFSLPLLLVLSLWLDGPSTITHALFAAEWSGWGAVLWQSIGNTLFAYAIWNGMLSRYPAAMVTPFALLVPVFGMSSSALLLHENFADWKLMATALILIGLALNTLAPHLTGKDRQSKPLPINH
jgi:O-acetylserine/cysteine efflux transporter